jgi:hypothetical protein
LGIGEQIMSYHGTGWQSMANDIDRAKRHADRLIDAANRGLHYKQKIRNPEKYLAAKVDRERVGLELAKPRTDKQVLLRLHSAPNPAKRPVSLANQSPVQPAHIDDRQEASQRMINIIDRCIDSLLIGLRMMLTANGDPKIVLPMTQKEAMGVVGMLCDLVGRNRPDFNLERQPCTTQPPLSRCVNCGLMLTKRECSNDGNVCDTCIDLVERQERMKEARTWREAQQATIGAKEIEIQNLKRAIKDLEDYARHGRHSRQDAETVETA